VPNPDPRQLYPSKPHFRQSYAFSGATPGGPKAFDDAFQTPKPASLCFNCGKIIVYGTLLLLRRRLAVVCGVIGLTKLPFPAATGASCRRMLADFPFLIRNDCSRTPRGVD
jgi:hypothetical protein